MSADLTSEREIARFVRRFNRDVAQDDLLGPIFNDVAKIDWADHIPRLIAFWCRALLHQPGFQGNPLRKHQATHAIEPFTADHFTRWLELFTDTLDSKWAGANVNRAKAFAHRIAYVHSKQLGCPIPRR